MARAMAWRTLRHNKYGAKRVVIDGYGFDSKAEARRYGELKLMGVDELVVHPSFPILINEKKIGTVILDFRYWDGSQWRFEDVKGVDTALSRLKRKMVEAAYGIKVTLIKY